MKAPLIKSRFFKLRTARKFEYIPMYYDADKERMEKRKARIAKEIELDKASISRESLRGRIKFDRNYSRRKSKKVEMWSSFRLIMILIILVFVCYRIFMNLDSYI